MQFDHGRWLASPTDLANFLACPHKTSLDRLVAGGKLDRPAWEDPIAEQLRRRGEAHERQYVARLASQGLAIVDLGGVERPDRRAKTLAAMRAGADVIVQAALQNDQWTGFADVLRKIAVPSALGGWSYEAHDTKLARETRGGTILQLSVYSDLIAEIQGRAPEAFHVVTPAGTARHRFDDYAAYFRQTRGAFRRAMEASPA